VPPHKGVEIVRADPLIYTWLGTPSHVSSPFPHPYRVIRMVMISIVGVAAFDKPGTGATSILQAVIWVSPKRQLRNATLAPSCALNASCAAA
jgi:hypothetical protein